MIAGPINMRCAEYISFATIQIHQVDNKIDQKRSKCLRRMGMTRNLSDHVHILFCAGGQD